MVLNESSANRQRTPVRLGLWSSEYSSLNGQALVTSRVMQVLSDLPWKSYTYPTGYLSMFLVAKNTMRLWKSLLVGDVDTIYLVCSRSGFGFVRDLPALMASLVGVRVVVHVHGSDITTLLSGRWYSIFARALYKRSELVVPSQHLVPDIYNLAAAKKCIVCENFVTRELPFVAGREARASPLNVLWNSNVVSSKGFFDVADAVKCLHERGHRIKMTAVGAPLGDLEMSKAAVLRRLEELRGFDWMTYLGRQDEVSLRKLLLEADVVCLPSRYPSECQPLAIIQAMCSGKAIVVSDSPALRSTVGEYPASVIAVGSKDELLAALRKFCEAELPVIADEVQSLVNERFSTERFDREIRDILEAGDGRVGVSN
ncbi:glycosyltransferase [Mesorhizobium sp. M1156]|uniref:glycosyltransferase n=1 Tax=unclassified Mesorhizobium TaxID=325217 RepID=UPI00333D4305